MEELSKLIVPLILCMTGVGLLFSRKDLFEGFVCGAKKGMDSAVGILPTLVMLMAAISMFNSSGASQMMTELLSPIVERVGIPAEIIPLVIVRPLSGGASTAMITDIFTKYGADSFAGRCASVICGSSDTVLYVVSVYFGAVGVKKTGKTLLVSLFVAVFCVFLAVFLCRLFF